MGPIHTIEDAFDMLRRRAGLIALVTLLGALGSVYFATQQQHIYQSAEVIQIAQPKIADELAPSTVAGSSARRLQLIQQRLMARGTVLEVVDKFGLFADLPLTPGEKVVRLREAVRIEGVAAAREGFQDDGTISVLTITVELGSPELAQLVAREFSARTLELSADSRIEQARRTLEFFVQQEDKLLDEIETLEREIADYRASHDVAIAGSLEMRRSQIQSINSAILDIDRERIDLERQLQLADQSARAATVERLRNELRLQIASLDEQQMLLQRRAEALMAAIETSPEVERELAIFERDMEKLQNQLDVIATRRAEAEVGFRLESNRQSEQLTVIEPAPLPDYAITSSRKRIAILGTGASLVLGVILAFFLDLLNPVIRSAAQMKREVGIAPVVAIPRLDARSYRAPLILRLKLWIQIKLEESAARRAETAKAKPNS